MGEARQCPLAHHVEGSLRLTEPAHAVVDPSGSEASLRQGEARALDANQILLRDPHRLIEDLGMVAELPVDHRRIVHRPNVTQDREPGGVNRHDDH